MKEISGMIQLHILYGNDKADTSMNNKQGEPLLKCGFFMTECPKK